MSVKPRPLQGRGEVQVYDVDLMQRHWFTQYRNLMQMEVLRVLVVVKCGCLCPGTVLSTPFPGFLCKELTDLGELSCMLQTLLEGVTHKTEKQLSINK